MLDYGAEVEHVHDGAFWVVLELYGEDLAFEDFTGLGTDVLDRRFSYIFDRLTPLQRYLSIQQHPPHIPSPQRFHQHMTLSLLNYRCQQIIQGVCIYRPVQLT